MGFSNTGKITTKKRRSLATSLPVSGEMGLEGLFWIGYVWSKDCQIPWWMTEVLGEHYKAKRASSVRSAFLWEPLGARAGWAGLVPGGDGTESAALARSSKNLSNSTGNKTISQKHIRKGTRALNCNQSLYLHWSSLPQRHPLSMTKGRKQKS